MTRKMGLCMLCREVAQLSEHHAQSPNQKKEYSIMICKRCHDLINFGVKE